MKKNLFYALPLAFLMHACGDSGTLLKGTDINPYSYQIEKNKTGKNGAVVSAHPLASEVGVAILKQGGNAVDAAIATQFALAVVYPGAGNIGGGGFLVARLADGTNVAIDFREAAPAAAHRDMYLDPDGTPRTDKSQKGHLASGIPGTVAGAFKAHKYAKLPMKDLIAPAVQLAEKGFVLTASEARNFNSAKEEFLKYSSQSPAFVKDTEWKEGDTLIQPDLAKTLKRIQENGMKGFYEGETAALIVEEMKHGGGIITLEDLKNYDAKERPIVQFNYKGYDILTMSLPSSGGVLLPQMLNMIEDRNIQNYAFLSPRAVQLMVEVERRAYADRAEFLGDPDHYKVPVEVLTSKSYAAERMKDYDSTKATPSSVTKPGVIPQSEETTHLSVYDKEGNAVAVTTTLNGHYGSRTIVAGAGFLMNNEMDDFSIKPGVPNMFGAVGGDANAIVPGKRMLSSMTPTIVLNEGKPYLVIGTPGGTTITTSVFQTIVDIIDFKMSVADAVNEPKFHHQWLPDEVQVEKDFPDSTRKALEAMGYKITQRRAIGRTEVIKILPDGSFEAVADKRGDDHAAAY